MNLERAVLRTLSSVISRLDRIRSRIERNGLPAPECRYRDLELGGIALQQCIDSYDFKTVLDIGSGAGKHANVFEKAGKKVTRFDFGKSRAFTDSSSNVIIGDFVNFDFKEKYDLLWVSHTLEHTIHTQAFLEKLAQFAKKDTGILAISVPPAKAEFVGGHVSLWTPALLIYRLVLAGIDCSDAEIMLYGYNISVIVKNKKNTMALDDLAWDFNDISRLSRWFPSELTSKCDGARVGKIYKDAIVNIH